MLSDLKFALRMWVKAPAFTAVALLTLALGIGANVAIFSLVDAILLRQLPVAHPEQLAILTNPNDNGTSYGTSGGNRGLLAYTEYQALRDRNTVFSGLLAAQSNTDQSQVTWGGAQSGATGGGAGGGGEPAQTKLVSANYFSVLGVRAYRGRTFAPTEGQNIGADPVAVMSYAYWNQRFNRDPGVVGRGFRLNGQVFTVIGVTPPGFFGENVGESPDLFFPLTMTPQVRPGRDFLHDPPGVSRLMWLQVIGRRKPGVTLARAQAESNVIFLRLIQQQAGGATDAQQRHDILNQKLQLSGGASGASAVRGQFTDPLLALFALVGLVLLLATVNLASLLLARAAARQKEMGVRLALGAARGRIIRQLLTESVLLSIAGGLLGALLAVWGDRLLLGMVGGNSNNSMPLDLHPDWRVLAFVAGLCVLIGVLFGLAPAARMARLNLNATLQSQGRGGIRHSRLFLGRLIRGGLPLGKVLVIGQVALSVILLAAAGLFVRSLQKLGDVPLGFNENHLVEFGIDAGAAGYKDQAAATFFHHLQDQIAAVPGVRGVALSMDGLFAGSECGLPIAVDGYTTSDGKTADGIRCDEISAQYFATTGIPIVLGRALNEQDATSGVKNAVINRTAERQFFKNRNPLGQQIHDLYPDDHGVAYTIVGVAQDAKYNSLDEKTPPRMYLSFFNGIPGDQPNGASVLVRGSGDAAAINAGLRQAIRSADPNIPMPTVQSLSEMVGNSLTSQTLMAKLSGFFGILALLLAAIGLYGVMAYGIARRTSEIGVRIALGADRGEVLGMILSETAVVTAIGIAIGLPASLAGAKLIFSQIHFFGLTYWDWPTFTAAAVVLAAVALLAGYLPARRASRIDPLEALRYE